MEWISKQHSYSGTSNADLSVSLVKNRSEKCLRLIFRNNSWKRINGEFVVVGFTGTKMFFKPERKEVGFKIYQKQDNPKNRYCKIPRECAGFVGDYELLFDKGQNLWYIDSEQKIIG